jgi:hypothetical protein
MNDSNIKVVRVASDLVSETWSFCYVGGGQVVLQDYAYEERATRRHKFQCLKSFTAHSRSGLNHREVPIPEDVAAEALAAFTKTLRIVRIYDRE